MQRSFEHVILVVSCKQPFDLLPCFRLQQEMFLQNTNTKWFNLVTDASPQGGQEWLLTQISGVSRQGPGFEVMPTFGQCQSVKCQQQLKSLVGCRFHRSTPALRRFISLSKEGENIPNDLVDLLQDCQFHLRTTHLELVFAMFMPRSH